MKWETKLAQLSGKLIVKDFDCIINYLLYDRYRDIYRYDTYIEMIVVQ